MAKEGNDDAYEGAQSTFNPAITYTRTRKTKTAASSTRRRNNTAGEASTTGNAKSWFARKASGWTDGEIRSHLVSGGASRSGGSLSMEGDLIQGNIFPTKKRRQHERNNKKRQLGPRFAWEEEVGDEADYQSSINEQNKSIMRAAPTLQDIMDEQDQIDLLHQQLRKDCQPSLRRDADRNPRNRRENAALAEIAQMFDNSSKFGEVTVTDTATTDSIGWRLLRVLGYRARLRVAFISLPGHSASKDDDGANDLMDLAKNLSAKHLASKGLRAIRLPSMTQKSTLDEKKPSNDQAITIPPPKTNKAGIGFDPFKNAPEFRAFKKKREALAKTRGREADRNDSSRSNAYFTDNLRRDDRQHLWNKDFHENDNGNNELNHHSDNQDNDNHTNFAAQDYTDFIGTKASSGFALEDEDDANVYQDDDLGGAKVGEGSIDRSKYTLEIQSPVASDAEDENNDDGLFHHPVSPSERKSQEIERSNVEDAWNAWGVGYNEPTTTDGKPPLLGFQLGQKSNDTTKRWSGPMLPSGYVLKRHVFPVDSNNRAIDGYTLDNFDCGLGLHLNQSRKRSCSSLPPVMPQSTHQRNSRILARNGTTFNFEEVKESIKSRFVSSGGQSNVDATNSNIEKNIREEQFVHVTSTSWMPSRLLCKRWGIPQPSYSNTSVLTEITGKVILKGEESYFSTTALPQHRGDEGAREHTIGMNPTQNYLEESLNEGYHSQPPLRPSENVFKTIFDDESDMEISSSDDDDEDGIGDSAATNETHIYRNISGHEFEDKPIDVDVNRHSPSSHTEYPPHKSNKPRHHRDNRHQRKKTRRRSPNESPHHSDDDTEEYDDKKRKKKKKRHKRSHSRHKEKRRR